MPIEGPWFLTPSAVRDYLRLTGQLIVAHGPIWDRACAELTAMAEDAEAASRRPGGRQPKRLESGALQYRGPKPLRLRLIVMPALVEGRAPQLVRVLPAHD